MTLEAVMKNEGVDEMRKNDANTRNFEIFTRLSVKKKLELELFDSFSRFNSTFVTEFVKF